MTLQQWLILQRQNRRLSQHQLAKLLQQSTYYVQEVELGIYHLDIIEYVCYCQALKINPKLGIMLIEQQLFPKS